MTQELLREALVHFELAKKYTDNKDLDQLLIDATCMRAVGRNRGVGAARLARAIRSVRNSWQFMWGMRNRIAHGYLLVDSDIVRQTIEFDLPDIVRVIRGELSDT